MFYTTTVFYLTVGTNQSQEILVVSWIAPTEVRTLDLTLTKGTLYQLSHRSTLNPLPPFDDYNMRSTIWFALPAMLLFLCYSCASY
jgi:hypothetical protein